MTDKILDDATPAKYFARPPYHAELFFERSGWSGVMNRDGLNVLTFKTMPGKTITSFDNAKRIADHWNSKEPE